LVQFKHGAPDNAEESESDASDGQVRQEMKSASSDEGQPFAPNG
ncbi:hypothetical protein BAE44_0004271, partial [Dichanthelium oligosanthes]